MSFYAVIPARLASSRLPGKPLLDIGGKPMVVQVLERARRSGAQGVWVAADDQRIIEAVNAAGGQALMTRADHANGTERLAEVAQTLGWQDDDIVVNVQGDEPLIDPALIADVAACLHRHADATVATVAHPLQDASDMFDSNVVKVVCDVEGAALYFSRAPIPWSREGFAAVPPILPRDMPLLRHVGLYAYRVSFLRRYSALSASPLEQSEALEQLRILWHGYRIMVHCIDTVPVGGVDTEKDLQRVRTQFKQIQ